MLILFAVAAGAAAASSKNPAVEREVKAELISKTYSELRTKVFMTKILVGGYVPCPQSGRNNAVEMVDTELSPNGSIRFYARANCFYPTNPGVMDLGVYFDKAKGYVSPRQFSGEIPPGTSVWVRGVDFKDDRIEVRLSTNNTDNFAGSGKIKYMLGKNYQTWSADEVMEAISQGIRIPAYEKLDQLRAEFEALRVSLEQAENQYNVPGGTAASRLANAIALKQVLENLQKNRAEFTAMGKTDPQAGVYSEKLSALAQEITKLEEEVHEDRVAQVRGQLQAQIPALSAIQSQVRQNPPSTMAEWQQRSDSLDKYSALLDERQKLFDKLKSENEAPSPEDTKNMNESRAEIQTDRASLQNEHQQIELADLTAQFRELTRKRAQMLDAYSRAFATPKEKSALQSLIAVLDEMVENRDRAAGLGDEAAQTQLIKCRAEADKYKRK